MFGIQYLRLRFATSKLSRCLAIAGGQLIDGWFPNALVPPDFVIPFFSRLVVSLHSSVVSGPGCCSTDVHLTIQGHRTGGGGWHSSTLRRCGQSVAAQG